MNDVDSDVDMNGIEQPCGVRIIDALSFEWQLLLINLNK